MTRREERPMSLKRGRSSVWTLLLCSFVTLLASTALAEGDESESSGDGIQRPTGLLFVTRQVLSPGDAVRFKQADENWRFGRFHNASDTDFLVYPRETPSDVLILSQSTSRLQVQTRSEGHTGMGLLLGAGLGFAIGYFGDENDNGHDEDQWIKVSSTGSGLFGMMVFGMLGGVFGTLVRTPVYEDVVPYQESAAR